MDENNTLVPPVDALPPVEEVEEDDGPRDPRAVRFLEAMAAFDATCKSGNRIRAQGDAGEAQAALQHYCAACIAAIPPES